MFLPRVVNSVSVDLEETEHVVEEEQNALNKDADPICEETEVIITTDAVEKENSNGLTVEKDTLQVDMEDSNLIVVAEPDIRQEVIPEIVVDEDELDKDADPVREETEVIISTDAFEKENSNGLAVEKDTLQVDIEDSDLVIAEPDIPEEVIPEIVPSINELVDQSNEETNEFQIEAKNVPPGLRDCLQCAKYTNCTILLVISGLDCYICSDKCLKEYRKVEKKGGASLSNSLQMQTDNSVIYRRCIQCKADISDNCISWEVMDFCNEECLAKYQTKIGSKCLLCDDEVSPSAMGKYCVRFGHDVKQFCKPACLDTYKKSVKTCCFCQLNLSVTDNTAPFLAPVGNKGYFRDFCSRDCLEKFDVVTNKQKMKIMAAQCAVCAKIKIVQVEILIKDKSVLLCSDLCMAAYKFVNKIDVGSCAMCKKYFDKKAVGELIIFQDDTPYRFCSKNCMNISILSKRKIIPCAWCKAKKYNFDMVHKKKLKMSSDNAAFQDVHVCSLNCLTLFTVSLQPGGAKKEQCFLCNKNDVCLYHLSMSDGTQRSFCTYECLLAHQQPFKNSPLIKPIKFGQHNFVTHTQGGGENVIPPSSENANSWLRNLLGQSPRVPKDKGFIQESNPQATPMTRSIDLNKTSGTPQGRPALISINKSIIDVSSLNLQSQAQQQQAKVIGPLKKVGGPPPPLVINPKTSTPLPVTKAPVKNQWAPTNVLVKPRDPIEIRNKMTQCRVATTCKSVSCKPISVEKHIQTDEEDTSNQLKGLIPVPVPIYVPAPMAMYSVPVPTLVPVPIPVPVPIFIPTTRNSAKGIFKEIKRIQDKMPSDPFEAEILMMAEMVAEDKKESEASSSSESESRPTSPHPRTPAQQQSSSGQQNTDTAFITETVMEGSNSFGEDMLQMALKMASEMEHPSDLDGTIVHQNHSEGRTDSTEVLPRAKKRALSLSGDIGNRDEENDTPVCKRRRASTEMSPTLEEKAHWTSSKPDASMSLKYTLGVNAWRQFAKIWNEGIDLGKEGKRVKTDLLVMCPEELNYSLTLFMKEAKMPDGSDYRPDAKYYLVLGIQYYLFENGRIDNIFYDSQYETFTDAMDDEARKFHEMYPEPENLITRIEEEHLWESKHLGSHSPHGLLSTLMYFNIKYFNLTTVEEHMQLSFSHIMKHWKRNTNMTSSSLSQPGKPGTQTRNVLLRFYPPQSTLASNSKKKTVYEQFENEDNPVRCPVRLYEFYLSKCPESVKSRNDIFYLQPERSCVPESPVWYSTNAISEDLLQKMLNRVKMVKEINLSILEQ